MPGDLGKPVSPLHAKRVIACVQRYGVHSTDLGSAANRPTCYQVCMSLYSVQSGRFAETEGDHGQGSMVCCTSRVPPRGVATALARGILHLRERSQYDPVRHSSLVPFCRRLTETQSHLTELQLKRHIPEGELMQGDNWHANARPPAACRQEPPRHANRVQSRLSS